MKGQRSAAQIAMGREYTGQRISQSRVKSHKSISSNVHSTRADGGMTMDRVHSNGRVDTDMDGHCMTSTSAIIPAHRVHGDRHISTVQGQMSAVDRRVSVRVHPPSHHHQRTVSAVSPQPRPSPSQDGKDTSGERTLKGDEQDIPSISAIIRHRRVESAHSSQRVHTEKESVSRIRHTFDQGIQRIILEDMRADRLGPMNMAIMDKRTRALEESRRSLHKDSRAVGVVSRCVYPSHLLHLRAAKLNQPVPYPYQSNPKPSNYHKKTTVEESDPFALYKVRHKDTEGDEEMVSTVPHPHHPRVSPSRPSTHIRSQHRGDECRQRKEIIYRLQQDRKVLSIQHREHSRQYRMHQTEIETAHQLRIVQAKIWICLITLTRVMSSFKPRIMEGRKSNLAKEHKNELAGVLSKRLFKYRIMNRAIYCPDIVKSARLLTFSANMCHHSVVIKSRDIIGNFLFKAAHCTQLLQKAIRKGRLITWVFARFRRHIRRKREFIALFTTQWQTLFSSLIRSSPPSKYSLSQLTKLYLLSPSLLYRIASSEWDRHLYQSMPVYLQGRMRISSEQCRGVMVEIRREIREEGRGVREDREEKERKERVDGVDGDDRLRDNMVKKKKKKTIKSKEKPTLKSKKSRSSAALKLSAPLLTQPPRPILSPPHPRPSRHRFHRTRHMIIFIIRLSLMAERSGGDVRRRIERRLQNKPWQNRVIVPYGMDKEIDVYIKTIDRIQA